MAGHDKDANDNADDPDVAVDYDDNDVNDEIETVLIQTHQETAMCRRWLMVSGR